MTSSCLYLITSKNEYGVKLALESESNDTAICLMQDAVYLACKEASSKYITDAIKKNIKVYVIEKDILKRGLKKLINPSIEIINYSEFVDLIFKYERILNL
ncbi:MAG: sulfurtransferase complex subunit TusB [Candidatus Njordarchaeia archaeon]